MQKVPSDTIVSMSPNSIVILDHHGRVVLWNEASQRLYGWGSIDAIGATMRDLLQCAIPDAPGAFPAPTEPFSGIFRRRARDGSIRRVDVVRLPYGEDGASPAGVVEYGREISGQVTTRRMLESATHRYQNLFNAMPASFWDLDFTGAREAIRGWRLKGIADVIGHLRDNAGAVRELLGATRIVDYNATSAALFGRGDSDELFQDLNFYWPDESLVVFANSVIAALNGESSFGAECVFRSLTGRHFEALFTVSMPAAQLERGQLLIGIVDVSAVHRAQAETEASERRYTQLFNANPTANIEIDCSRLDALFDQWRAEHVTDLRSHIDAHPALVQTALAACRVVCTNARFASLTRANILDDPGVGYQRLWDRSPHVFRRVLEAKYERAERFESQALLSRVDGTPIHCLVSCSFRSIESRPGIMLVNLVDVSDRVTTEERLAQTQAELAHAGRIATLGELAASIAHEVSQPLAAITIDSLAALRWLALPEPDHDELRAIAERAVSQAQRAADVLSRIKKMVRREQAALGPVDLSKVVSDALAVVRDELRRNRVTAETTTSPDLPHVHADHIQIQQVVMNLMLNASQAMGLTSSMRRLRVSAEADETHVRLLVDDTGPGISPDDLDRLFESFFTTKEHGMGMGLPICRTIVNAHGGEICVDAAPAGWATRFMVRLPRIS